MFERFDTPARRVLTIAQQEAQAFRHDAIATEHLLLGVAAQADEWAAIVLARRGLTAARIRREIERIVGRGAVEQAVPGIDAAALATLGIDLEEIRRRVEATFGPGALDARTVGRRGCDDRSLPFTPQAKKALELGVRECREQGHELIAPHDIALGLLTAGGVGTQILTEHGIDPAALRAPRRAA